jgi:hypothetical protein
VRGAAVFGLYLWGSEMRLGGSCGQLGSDVVLMGESAEDLFAVDPVLGEVDGFGWAGLCLSRGELAEEAMRPGRVVVPQVLGQHPVQVLRACAVRNCFQMPAARVVPLARDQPQPSAGS